MIENEYNPDYVSPPGETLQETLDERDMSASKLAAATHLRLWVIQDIIAGKAAITSGIALRLEQALGVPAMFWIQREAQYRLALKRAAVPCRVPPAIDAAEKGER